MIDLLVRLAVESSLRAAALLAMVAVILALFRIRSSSTRHAAWTAALVAMLMMPVLTRIVPAVHVPTRVPVPNAFGPLVPPPPVPRIDTPLPSLPPELTSGATALPVAVPGMDPGDGPPAAPASPVRWNVIGLVVYLIGVSFFFIRFVIGLYRLSRIYRSSQRIAQIPGDVAWESALVATPVTIGLVAPRVILPVTWRAWSKEMRAAVLAHERAHAARRDPLIAVIARLNVALFWCHPLAWWLERKLATLAEHACDDAALKQVARRQYASTLLDIAATVRRHNGRLAWQGVGVDGDGRLGSRIDRVLSGTSWPPASRTRRALVAASCAVVIAIAVACQQEAKVEPLREDPALAATLKLRKERMDSYETARRMTPEEVAALEATLQRNPEDSAARERLLTYYAGAGDNTPRRDEKIAGRRRHAVWIVENHPDSDLIWSVSEIADPEGYATLRALWLEYVARKDASTKVLSNAARFFENSEKELSEQLLLRGKALEPDGPLPRNTGTDDYRIYVLSWSERLGRLYSDTLLRASDQKTKAWARERLEKSNDGEVLLTAGYALAFRPSDHELQAFGRRLLERASQLDSPAATRARNLLQQLDRGNSSEREIVATPPESRRALLDKTTGAQKMRQLSALAEADYLMAEYYDWRARQPAGTKSASPNVEEDKREAAEGFARAKAYAREAVDLAPALKDPGIGEAAFSAHLAYGLNLFREGDRKGAVEHMLDAAKLPAPDQQPAGGWASGLEYRLVFYLLKNGERQTIIDYFERAAEGRSEARRKVMLASAAAIREGRMPEHYQMLVASGSL